MRKALIVMMAGLAVHQVLYSQAMGGPFQIVALGVASVGAAQYAQALGRKPIWGLLAFLATPGILILVVALRQKTKEPNKESSNQNLEHSPDSANAV